MGRTFLRCGVMIALVLSCVMSWESRADFYSVPETPLGFYQSTSGCACQKGEFRSRKGSLPESYTISNITAAKDQAPLGTCVSFTAGALVESYNPGIKVSEAEFTIRAQTTLKDCKDSGLNLGQALKLLKDQGMVRESHFPYEDYVGRIAARKKIPVWQLRGGDDIQLCSFKDYRRTMEEFGKHPYLWDKIPKYHVGALDVIHHVSARAVVTLNKWENYNEYLNYEYYTNTQSYARKNEIKTEYKQNLQNIHQLHQKEMSTAAVVGKSGHADILTVKKALACNNPVAVALGVYENCWEMKDEKALANNIIRMPHLQSQWIGSHAIALVGYDDTRKSFVIKNSWGQGWGYKGFAYLPYEYLRRYATEIIAVSPPTQSLNPSLIEQNRVVPKPYDSSQLYAKFSTNHQVRLPNSFYLI